ncbi:acyl-CoA dehydrogenase family protein, partial [Alphaproteobacteria bacterium]|nr:acyl-CoA dehydrogenase family protein [Alphaproteobacteria bacterium]
QTELAVVLAPACASSAWVASVTACHGWILGMFPPQAQNDVWGKNSDASVASSFLPFGPDIKRVGGGLQINGRWGFSSGVDYCSWAVLTMTVPPINGDGEPEAMFALVPLNECTIVDTWHTTGLSGTGSNDIIVEDTFVPDHRTVAMAALRGGASPGSEVNPGYLYRLPQRATFSFNLVGTAIGAARGAVQAVISELSRRITVGGANLQGLSSVQYRIAEAEAELAAAYALMARNRDEIIRNGKADQLLSAEDRGRYRRDNAYSTRLCVQAVDRVYPVTGGRGIAVTNAVNRAWRDVHAVSHHIALTWDVSAATAGALAVGAPNPDPLL